MNDKSIIKPDKLNMDIGRKYLPADSAFYLLNHDVRNKNALGKATPMPANYPACEMDMPGGENYAPNTYHSERTNETYSWVYNNNGVHFVQRINAEGKCEIVYDNRCLKLSPDPAHEITQQRAYLRVERTSCLGRHGKELIWVDGFNEFPCCLDVEASIATDSFTTPFFTKCDTDPCDFISLCVPKPCGCIQAEFVPLKPEEIGWTNHLVDIGIKIMFKHEYYDGRMSEWSDRSTLYYQDSKGCFDSIAAFPRCLKIRVPVGNPMVTRIHIAFNKSEFDEAGNNLWYETEVVEKYEKYAAGQYWYERQLSEEITGAGYSDEDCAFDYYFCNDKQCKPVDPKEVSRVYNPMPRKGQGVITIKDAIGIYNYISGNCPLDKGEVNKVKLAVVCDDNSIPACVPEFATITVRAFIYNDVYHRNQFVYRLGGTSQDLPDDLTDTAYFGGISNVAPDFTMLNGFDQQFADRTRNFIAYIEGEEVWGEMSQKIAGPNFTNPKDYGVVSGMNTTALRGGIETMISNGYFFYQEVKLKVRKGKKGFIRLTSQHSTGLDSSKSTFVEGLVNIKTYAGWQHIAVSNTNEELYFDTCNGDVNLYDAFVIKDNAVSASAVAFNGYVTDANGRPVEGAIVMPVIGSVEQTADACTTDFNGFYHTKTIGTVDQLRVKVEQNPTGNFTTIQTENISGNAGTNTQHDIVIADENYKNHYFENVIMKVTDCHNEPVGGVRVALSGSKYRDTGSDGIARFKIRNYESRQREAHAVVMDHNGCFTLDCADNCNPCLTDATVATPTTYASMGTVDLGVGKINTASALSTKKGLKAGGLYPMAINIESPCGKISAAYELPALRIPKTQDKGQLSFCNFSYDATGIKLPFDGCMKILRGENLNNYELQWMVDRIDRVDGKIKLTIQSLNDYDAKYFFKTNTIYQWLKGDRVEFIRNGDGKIFKTADYGLLNYLTLSPFHDMEISGQTAAAADYFNQLIIEDDGKLDGLVAGAVIELQRSKECVTLPTYFDICVSIPIIEGKLLHEAGKFTTFDTFLVNRTLTYKDSKGKSIVFPSQTFEHHSPSDFWGDHLNDTGKAYFVNKFEDEKRNERSVSINAALQFSYFGDLVKTFDAPEQGAIIGMNIVDGKVIHAICEHDNFMAQTADELVRVGGDGIIRAIPADQIISEAQPKVSGAYGCQYAHVGSIFYGDGYAFWADVNKGHYIIFDYSSAQIAAKDKAGDPTIQLYTSKRFADIQAHNRSQSDFLNHYRFAVGHNAVTRNLHITLKTLRQPAVNNEKAPFLKGNDTLVYSPHSDEFLTFHSATPEGYSRHAIYDENGCAMVMYYNGVPYILPANPIKYNEFFGIACDWIVGVVLNKYPTKIKIPIAMEIESGEDLWYVPQGGIITEETGFVSEIPPVRVKKNESKWNAAFLNNVNSRGGLYNGPPARSYATSITLIRDNTDELKYNSLDKKKQIKYGTIDLILIKFAMSEQAGFDTNL